MAGTRGTNTQEEQLTKMLGELGKMMAAPDADPQWISGAMQQIVSKLQEPDKAALEKYMQAGGIVPGMSGGPGNAPPGPMPGAGGAPMGGPPGGGPPGPPPGPSPAGGPPSAPVRGLRNGGGVSDVDGLRRLMSKGTLA